MAGNKRATPPGTRTRIDRDGVKIIETIGGRNRLWWFVSLLALLMAGLLISRLDRTEEAPVAATEVLDRASERSPIAPPEPRPRPQPIRVADSRVVALPALDDPPADSDQQPASEPNFTLPKPGAAPTGIALFPPPGTDPPRTGIVVPDDFELPDGFVRHHQATDDGQELPAILMFHPDFDWYDENGERIEIPASRVVPPEMAPEGLEIEMLELPDDLPETAP